MRKNDRSRPNNWCVVNVQLDPHRAELFYRMKNATGGDGERMPENDAESDP